MPFLAASSFFRSLGSSREQSSRVSWPTGASSGFHVVEKGAAAVNARKGSRSHPHGLQCRSHHDKCGSEPQQCKTAVRERIASVESSSSEDDGTSRPATSKTKAKKSPGAQPKYEQTFTTKNSTTTTKPTLAARTKDLRLKGADLYVARLGSCPPAPRCKPRKARANPDPKPDPKLPSKQPAPLLPQSPPQSCYDELSLVSRAQSPGGNLPAADEANPEERPEIRASRPCYRCVMAMHAVGIKRVFWTNAVGAWEGAKVRELVEALDGGGGVEGVEGTGGEKGMFVTTHDVLMMQRVMGF